MSYWPGYYWAEIGELAGADAYMHDDEDSWQWIDGVETARYTDSGGTRIDGVKLRRGTLTASDYAGASIALSPQDVPFVVWLNTITTMPALSGVFSLPEGGSTIAYYVVAISGIRGDGQQIRVICRKGI